MPPFRRWGGGKRHPCELEGLERRWTCTKARRKKGCGDGAVRCAKETQVDGREGGGRKDGAERLRTKALQNVQWTSQGKQPF